jgi:hypothetical protein
MVIGAVLLTVQFAHAMQPTPFCIEHPQAKTCQFPLWIYRPLPEATPARTQINVCLKYGFNTLGYNMGAVYAPTPELRNESAKRELKAASDKMDDWLYFCMQQARWSFKDECHNNLPENTFHEECWLHPPLTPRDAGRLLR